MKKVYSSGIVYLRNVLAVAVFGNAHLNPKYLLLWIGFWGFLSIHFEICSYKYDLLDYFFHLIWIS